MDTAMAVATVKGDIVDASPFEKRRVYQALIDNGMIWRIADEQGRSAGREAQNLINTGVLRSAGDWRPRRRVFQAAE